MTVKVFRVDPPRPLAGELRSWDKGDAALMDLNNRGVPTSVGVPTVSTGRRRTSPVSRPSPATPCPTRSTTTCTG